MLEAFNQQPCGSVQQDLWSVSKLKERAGPAGEGHHHAGWSDMRRGGSVHGLHPEGGRPSRP